MAVDWTNSNIVVTGGSGFVGSFLVDELRTRGVAGKNLKVVCTATHDLRSTEAAQDAVDGADIVFHLAAVTGGIQYCINHPASQYFESTVIDLNVFKAAADKKVKKVIGIGNAFAFGGGLEMPLNTEKLFVGLPGVNHLGLGSMKRNLATIATIYHKEFGLDSTIVYSSNVFGPGDTTDLTHAHVIPSLILKCLKDPKLVVWGDGSSTRDFLYGTDCARMLASTAEVENLPRYFCGGSGIEVSVNELVEVITTATGFTGEVEFDISKHGGDSRRVFDASEAKNLIGFSPNISFKEGIEKTVNWYRGILN